MQTPLLQCLAQCSFQRQPLLGQAVHFAAEKAEAPTPLALGLVHGHIGTLQQGFHIAPVSREHGNADAGRNAQRGVGHRHGLRQQLLQPLNGARHLVGIALRQHGDKLITRQTPRNIGGAQHLLQALGHDAEQIVTRRMTQRVVDLLEAVKVDEQHGQLFVIARCRSHGLIGLSLQQTAIGQTRQAIVESQLANTYPRMLALQRQRAQMGAGISQLLVKGQ